MTEEIRNNITTSQDSAPAFTIFWTTTPEGRVEKDHPAWRAFTGQTEEETKDYGWLNVVHPDDREIIKQASQKSAVNKSFFVVEYRIRRADGVYRLFELRGIPVFKKKGSAIREWVGTYIDITEKKRLEEQLRLSEQRFRSTFEQSSIGIAYMDLDGCGTLINQRFCDIVGYTIEELTAQSLATLLPPEEQAAEQLYREQLLDCKLHEVREEKCYLHKSGTSIWVQRTITLIYDEQNQPDYFTLIIEDITEQKKSVQRMEAFLGIASHELKTPLTTINFNLQVAERVLKQIAVQHMMNINDVQKKIATIQEMIRCATGQVTLLNRLVSDLIDVSRIQADKLELHLRKKLCDLAAIVQEAVQNMQHLIPGRLNLSIAPTQQDQTQPSPIDEMMAPIFADPDRIGQVVTNYLTNAIRFSPPDTSIDVHLQIEKTEARASVRDYGAGLAIEEQEQVWERFYQGQDSHTGLGLGLYISRSIIERQAGQVGVQSDQGHGSTFWFTLPLAPQQSRESQR